MNNEIIESEIHQLLSSAMIENIEAIENEMLKHEQVDIPTKSNNINGMYTRQILIPKGTIITGRVHLYDYVDIMLSGDISVATQDGVKRYSGYNVFHGAAGRKRAGYAHDDTHWITIHNSKIKDGDEFYNTLTVQSLSDYRDRKDYLLLLSEIGMSDEDVCRDMDLIKISTYKHECNILKSCIHGVGLFASINYEEGSIIGLAYSNNEKTELGRYTNHSVSNNAKYEKKGNDIILIALKNIKAGEEITTNYRDTINSGARVCLQ